MKLATLKDGSRDGRLVVVSRDLRFAAEAERYRTLQDALDCWAAAEGEMESLYAALNDGRAGAAFAFKPSHCEAPLPRSPQWCDGSAFLNHVRLMETAFNTPAMPDLETIPLMYQGGSDDFLGPRDDVPLPDESHGIDFEGEFGVIVAEVPMSVTPAQATAFVRLIVQINDVSLRGFGPREMRTGFGFFHAKPSSSFAPVAVTPDELGDAWQNGRVNLPLKVEWNGNWFGQPNGGEMSFSFYDLIAHAATTRRLRAGTIIGSGTVSNAGGAAGSACIAERRAIETIKDGKPSTSFMRFGDRVRMEARTRSELPLFGAIDQQIVRAPKPT